MFNRYYRRIAALAIVTASAILFPMSVAAHAELETSTPADGTTVPGPFEGPIVLTFSADLVEGSKADLVDQGGGEIASAVVDGPGAKMTITLDVPLGPDDYEVKWVSVAEDGDLDRGTVSFTVAPAPPTPEPTPEPTPSASPVPSSTPIETDGGASTGDVLIPIVVGLLIVALGAVSLLSRRGRSTP